MKPKDVREYMWVWLGLDLGIDMKQVCKFRDQLEGRVKSELVDHSQAAESADQKPESDEEEEAEEEDDRLSKLQKKKEQRKNQSAGRIGVSAEVYGKNNKKQDFVPPVIPKSQEAKTRIEVKLGKSFMFKNLDRTDKDIVINAMEERVYEVGDAVISQGDDGDVMFLVDSGKLECSKVFEKDSPAKFLRHYFEGDSFGELALLYNTRRATTIKAIERSTVFALDRATFTHIVKEASVKKRDRFEDFLGRVELLSGLNTYERSKICDALQSEFFNPGEVVIKEGESGNKFYLVEEGLADVYKIIGTLE
jgi:cAMP-dependent protein kinase regulator